LTGGAHGAYLGGMQIIDLDGRQLATWDRGHGTPLLFIHGVGTSGALWQADLADLAADCRVIVYDRRGYGASSESPRDWEAHREDAAALLENLAAERAVVVGYSGGAIVALDLALQRPELVRELVLLDPAFNLKRCMTPGLIRHLVTARLLNRLGRARRGAEHWMRYVASYPSGGSAFDKASAERREALLDNADAIFADFSSGAGDHVPEDRFAGIETPTTIVDCKLSPSFLRRSCKRLRALMPQARSVTLENSGHHVAVDAREELVALLRDVVVKRDEASAPAATG
jgi:pimeloyl-ACP methyl ester carboxylesterase